MDRPRVVVLDLDGLCWWPEMYMLQGKPRRSRHPPHAVTDATGERIDLLGETESILASLHSSPDWADTAVAYASRTTEPAYARAALAALPVAPGVAMADVAAVAEIYPGRKTTHMAAIAAATGVSADEMIFFDNERRNCVDVAGTGALAVYAPSGLTGYAWEAGLAAYAQGERGCIIDGEERRGSRGGRRRW
ncbi:hypothetical protein MMPV_007772 [Pyropia vietnamensis]